MPANGRRDLIRSLKVKWTRPFRRKKKSGFWACAITFQTQSTTTRPSACHRLKIFTLANPWLQCAAVRTLCYCSYTADHCAAQCKVVCGLLLLVGIVRIPPVTWMILVSVWLCRPFCYDLATERFAQFTSNKTIFMYLLLFIITIQANIRSFLMLCCK